MNKQYDLSKLRLIRRGAIAGPTTQVRRSIRLDLDVVTWLVKESARRGLSCSTLINDVIKEAIQTATSLRDVPEIEFDRFTVRRNRFATRVRREGIELITKRPPKRRATDVPRTKK